MTNIEWKNFFILCNEILGIGDINPVLSNNWCAWTTFSRLSNDSGYWTSGLPTLSYIDETHIKDNSSWKQPFLYQDIAHIIIPKEFFWEKISSNTYENGVKLQNIDLLSKVLDKANLYHNCSSYALDIKLF